MGRRQWFDNRSPDRPASIEATDGVLEDRHDKTTWRALQYAFSTLRDQLLRQIEGAVAGGFHRS